MKQEYVSVQWLFLTLWRRGKTFACTRNRRFSSANGIKCELEIFFQTQYDLQSRNACITMLKAEMLCCCFNNFATLHSFNVHNITQYTFFLHTAYLFALVRTQVC